MLLCDVHFRYDDEDKVRVFVVNAPLTDVGHFVQRISNKACVAQVFVNIHPVSINCEFHEFTL